MVCRGMVWYGVVWCTDPLQYVAGPPQLGPQLDPVVPDTEPPVQGSHGRDHWSPEVPVPPRYGGTRQGPVLIPLHGERGLVDSCKKTGKKKTQKN